MLACNPHLEAGKPLAEWLPDLPVTYRYPLDVSLEDTAKAQDLVDQADHKDMLIGVSCASYRGAEAWNTWNVTEWLHFLHLLQAEVPCIRFALLGGSWDDLTAEVFDYGQDLRWLVDVRGIPPVGRTTFGTACELLKRCAGYIGFSSGLGHVACHCCGTPTFMLWPEHEQLLSRSWVDPELLETGFYEPSRWLEPDVIFQSVKSWLRRSVTCQ